MPHRLLPNHVEESSEPLSEEELKHLRKIMRADERARWFWATIRMFALWLTAVAVAVVAVKNTIVELFLSGKH